jgi:hypothetical protein
MYHAVELAAVLLLMSVGQGALDLSPRPVRRIAFTFIAWIVAFGAGIVVLSIPVLTVWALRLGIVVLTAYIARWIVAGIVDSLTGPNLLDEPGTAELAEAAHEKSGLPEHEVRCMARTMARRHDGFVALLGVLSIKPEPHWGESDFAAAWEESCEKARARVLDLARRFGGELTSAHPSPANGRFIAQASCLYEPESVERALARLPAPALGGRRGRARLARQLKQAGKRNRELDAVGLFMAAQVGETRTGAQDGGISFAAIVWPPLGFARAGFSSRARAFGVCEVLLAAYGLTALGIAPGSGWVFLAVAVLLHIQGAFAVADLRSSGPTTAGAPAGRRAA